MNLGLANFVSEFVLELGPLMDHYGYDSLSLGLKKKRDN